MKYDTLWIHANIATMAMTDPGLGIIRDGALACTDGVVSWLGPVAELPGPLRGLAGQPQGLAGQLQRLPGQARELGGNVVDCGGKWIFPGLVDCHTHVVFGGHRADEFELRCEGVSYETIARRGGGILGTVARTREAPEEELFRLASRRVRNLIRDGVTTVEIKSGYGLDTETEAKMLRVARRIGEELPITARTTFLGAHAVPREFGGDRRGYLDLVCDEMLPSLAADGLVDAVDAFCESIAFSPGEVERVFGVAESLDLPVKLHTEQLSCSGGTAMAARLGALSVDHLEYLDEAGAEALAWSGTVAVLLPGAFYTLKETRRPPVSLLRDFDIPLAVATDCNPGTSPVLSLRLAANMSIQLFELTVGEALRAITCNAARALGMADSAGSLEVGKQADFLLCDIDLPVELLYWIGGSPIDSVVRRGEPIDFTNPGSFWA